MTNIVIKELSYEVAIEGLKYLFEQYDHRNLSSFCNHTSWFTSYLKSKKLNNKPIFIGVFITSQLVALIPVSVKPIHKSLPFIKVANLFYDNEMGICDFPTTVDIKLYWQQVKSHLKKKHVIILKLQGLLEDSLAIQSGALNVCDYHKLSHHSKWLDCSQSYDDFLSLYNSKFRRNLKRKYNKATKSGTLELKSNLIADTNHNLDIEYKEFLALEDSGWKGDIGTSIIKQKNAKRYYDELFNGFKCTNTLIINNLYLNGKIIAGSFCANINRTLFILKITYNEEDRSISPGQLLISELIRFNESRNNFDKVSFVTGTEWMNIWKPKKSQVFVTYSSLSILGKLLIYIHQLRSRKR